MALERAYQRRLPFFGQLNIKNPEEYLKKSKKDFDVQLNSIFPCTVLLKNFKFLYFLQNGGSGRIILSLNKDDHTFYVVKVFKKKDLFKSKQITEVSNEKRILQSLNSPFCMRLEYFCQDNSYLYLFMHFALGGDVFTLLQRSQKLDEELVRFYASQVVLAFEYLHYLNLVYRDLKPENLVIDHFGYLKLTDFGLCKVVTTRTYTFCGTPDYISPEVISGHGYGRSVDWWALGVLVFELSTGLAPFQGRDDLDLFEKILTAQFSTPASFSKELRDVVSQLLEVDVSKRLGNLSGGVEDVKRHRWFRTTHWLQLLNRRVTPPYVPPSSHLLTTKVFPHLESFTELKVARRNKFGKLFHEF